MRKYYLLLLFAIVSLSADAQHVSEQQALVKAQAFMKGKKFKPSANARSLSRARSKKTADESLYIFNVENKGGFVIVSGDERTEPILGYSTSGEIDYDRMPDNLRAWLEGYEVQIQAIKDNRSFARPCKASVLNEPAVGPLVVTKWNQAEPYNLECPIDDEEGLRSLTGCVATALAQVMYYYRWPENCTSIPAYRTRTKGIDMDMLSGTSFNWDMMKEEYDEDETDEEAQAVAKLMRYCGQAVEMDYTRKESLAHIETNLITSYFGYSSNMRTVSRSDYTSDEWNKLIYRELSDRRPVLYSGGAYSVKRETGYMDYERHQFICDGYDGNGLFHFNFGWGGTYDGYFLISLTEELRDNDEGTWCYDIYGYSLMQEAILGFQPKQQDEKPMPQLSSISCYVGGANKTEYDRGSSWVDFEDVVLQGSIGVTFGENVDGNYTMEVGFGLFDGDRLLTCIGFHEETVSAGTEIIDNSLTASFGMYIDAGEYQICQIYRLAGESGWEKCLAWGTNYIIATINYNQVLKLSTPFSLYDVGEVNTSYNPFESQDIYLTADITNRGYDMVGELILYTRKSGFETDWNTANYCVLDIEHGQSGTAGFRFRLADAGTYDLEIRRENEVLLIGTFTKPAIEHVIADGLSFAYIPEYKMAEVVSDDNYKYGGVSGILTIPASISTPEGVECQVVSIGAYAFNSCDKITEVKLPEGLKLIGEGAFSSCWGLQKVEIPSTVTTIRDYAFRDNNRMLLVISHITDLFDISDNVFEAYGDHGPWATCATINVPVGLKYLYQYKSGWNKFGRVIDGDMRIVSEGGLDYLILENTHDAEVIAGDYLEMNSIDIPASIYVDGEQYPYTVTTIGFRAFYGCYNLTAVTLPEGLSEIRQYAFAYTYIESLSLPTTITCIEDYAFDATNALTAVYANSESPVEISDKAFSTGSGGEYGPTKATLYVPTGMLETYKGVDGWSQFAAIDEGQKVIKVDDIYYMYSTAYKTAKVIGDAEAGKILDGSPIAPGQHRYDNMEKIVVKSPVVIDGEEYTVNAIDDYAFYQCWADQIIIPNTVKSIGRNSFMGCVFLRDFVIPEGLETIAEGAFYGCRFYELELPSSLQNIDTGAFSNCNYLKSLFVRGEKPADISKADFTESFSATLYVPENAVENYKNAEGWRNFAGFKTGWTCFVDGFRYLVDNESTVTLLRYDYNSMESVEVPGSVIIDEKEYQVRKVSCYAFFNDKNLTSVVLSEGVEEVDDAAFSECQNLETVLFPSTLRRIGDEALSFCYALKDCALLPENLEEIGREAFNGCFRMPAEKSVILPPSMKKIGKGIIIFSNVISRIDEPFAIDEDGVYSLGAYNNGNIPPLYVPKGTRQAYLSTDGWNVFQRVRESRSGDVNDDGTVSIVDAEQMIEKIMSTYNGGYKERIFNQEVCDMNADGNMDVFDVSRLISSVLSSDATDAPQTENSKKATVTVGNTRFTPSVVNSIDIMLDNEDEYLSCQFDLHLPEGFHIGLISAEADPSRMPETAQILGSNMIEHFRYLATSLEGETIKGRSGRIMSVQVNSYETVSIGRHTAYLRNVKLSRPDGTGVTIDEIPVEFTVKREGDVDVNNDDMLDTKDLTDLVSFIAGKNPENVINASADVNGDGIVNVADVILLANILLFK